LTTRNRFLLDNEFFSSIIYIWYEGVRLRPPLVKLDGNKRGRHQAEPGPSGGQMAKKAKKAAKKAKKAKKK
jgi:hypothetical protein